MKRTVLLLLMVSLVSVVFSQRRSPVSTELTKMSLTRVYEVPADPEPPVLNLSFAPASLKESRLLGEETEIIETVYDLQTNSTLANRIVVWGDGTMAAVAMRGVENPTNFAFPDRGTGYNYFNGTSWGPKPTARIESVRTGWPSIAKWGPNGEVISAHRSGTLPLVISRRTTKGSGPWTEALYYGPAGTGTPQYLWPRMITSGPNNEYMHLFALTAPSANGGAPWLGQDGALLYNRSTDGGVTFDIQHQQIPGTGADYYLYIRADDYTLASRGDIVALLHSSPWRDLFILKSTDNGTTWQKIMVWEHPYPFFDVQSSLTTDTLYSVDGSATLAIDQNGMVHVVWGITRVARLAANPPSPGSYSYWPYTDGIGYWNESMGQIPDHDNPHKTLSPEYLETLGMLVGWTQDVNNSGFIFDYEGTASPPFNSYRSLGISTMPAIAISGNMIMIAYSSVTETFVTADGTMNYKHIWTRWSYDLGQTWGVFKDLQADNIFHLFDECIYPVLAADPNQLGAFQLIYMADNIPGLYLDNDHDPVVNRIIHNNMNYTIGIDEPAQPVSSLNVSLPYPNPARGITRIGIELGKPSQVTVEIFSLTGQKVFELPARYMNSGSNAVLFDVSDFTPGLYFITVSAGDQKATQKMVVK